MPRGVRLDFIVAFTSGVSIFGLITTLIIALYTPIIQDDLSWRKPLVGSIFALICLSGTVAVFFPKKCSESFHSENIETTEIPRARNPDSCDSSITVKGHHPDCGRFSAHVILIDKHVICAACTGLLFGAFLALAGAVLYFFAGWNLEQGRSLAVLVGQIGVLLGFVQFKFRGYVRLTLNALFVLGGFLILAGIDSLVKSVLIDSYLLVLIVFWVFTRILISRWDHWRICQECELSCEVKEKQGC
jgi:hypothetical protein